MLRELNLDGFVDELASKSPAPGGGSAAALTGSLGASLTSMVYNLTIGTKAEEKLEPEVVEKMKKAGEEILRIKTQFVDLLEEDTASFTEFMTALGMPKATDEEKAERKTALDAAKVKIMAAPEKIAKLGDSVWPYVELANDYGNINAISDAGVSALLIDASIKAALLNVKINLPMVKDEARKEELTRFMAELTERSTAKSREIFESVSKKLDE